MDDSLPVDWKITDLESKDGIVKSAKYYVIAGDENLKVSTEGYCYFHGFGGVLLDDVTEEIVINWIKEIHSKDGICFIIERLKEQIEQVQDTKQNDLPWKPKTFKLTI